MDLTSITDSMVSGADPIEKILPEFIDFIGDSVVVAHNAGFDTGFIKKNCRDMDMEFKNPNCGYSTSF